MRVIARDVLTYCVVFLSVSGQTRQPCKNGRTDGMLFWRQIHVEPMQGIVFYIGHMWVPPGKHD